jgi:NADH-quinone oxidoreductase subunit N
LITSSSFYLLAPEISVLVLALIVMMASMYVRRRIIIAGIALVGLIVPAAFAIVQALTLKGSHTAFSGMLVVDPYALFFNIVFLLIAAVIILASYEYLEKYVRADGEFYALLLFSVMGMMLMASTGELISIYIALELTSMSWLVCCALIRSRRKPQSSISCLERCLRQFCFMVLLCCMA